MLNKHLLRSTLLGVTLIVSACGASSDVGLNRAQRGETSSAIRGGDTMPPPVIPTEGDITPADAARLAKQASFGPTNDLVNHMVALGSASDWINEQMSLNSSSYRDLAQPIPANICSGKMNQDLTNCQRDNFSAFPSILRFYKNAIHNDDQLRQRVAFALSQILVASELEVHIASGVAGYNQIFLDNAFGNYRDILREVTLNPFMGNYLDMAYSNKKSPNENYAREMMQLFSIGTVLLNQDGSIQKDSTGSPIATYNNNDVKEIARALTGWGYTPFAAPVPTDDYTKPMITSASIFDAGTKSFLGTTIPTTATQQNNVDAVLDTLFYHPNCAPFVSKRLIQQLVTSNPSPAYIARVSAAFSDNGAGARGDMKAVIKAILLDPEARGAAPTPGKVKEPVLLMTSLARAIGFTTDGYAFYARDGALGQRPFYAQSVFNYYPYDYPMQHGGNLVSPVSKITTTFTNINRHNLVYDWTIDAVSTRYEFRPLSTLPGSTGSQLDWSQWEALAANENQLLNRIDILLLNGAMTAEQRRALSSAMSAIKNDNPAAQNRQRAQAALYIAASSPMFQVDR